MYFNCVLATLRGCLTFNRKDLQSFIIRAWENSPSNYWSGNFVLSFAMGSAIKGGHMYSEVPKDPCPVPSPY